MMLLDAFVATVAAIVLNVGSTELFYYDPPDSERSSLQYRTRGSGSIPLEHGEKLVMRDEAAKLNADSLIVVVNQEYSTIKANMRELVARKLGIAEEHENLNGAIPSPKEHLSEYLGGGSGDDEAPS